MHRAVFLDRDGVINVERAYVCRVEDFHFIEGVFSACRQFQEWGYLLVIITNQSGIALGYYSEEAFLNLTDWMLEQFHRQEIEINGVYYCPHHFEGEVLKYRKKCHCRKPEPGMILKARDELNLDLSSSVLVGDKEADIEAALNAGVSTNILVRSGHPVNEKITQASYVVDSIRDVPALLQKKHE